ncbi:MAG: LysR family transcriptional regulator [Rhodospirillales bacterium]|nr:LysR family transcriptional regulator [Rhodospirillales bacterium]MBT4626629.1 LysR family transcriptional regulator [Rhodospirillales bacterium]
MKQLPHLSFLRSFEAAARHLSFTAASEELGCTQSAVSNHVRSLETFIGHPLFVRLPRSLTMTDVAEAYLPSVRHALQEIDAATQSLISKKHTREIVISCPFSLAEAWLPTVLEGFSMEHPDVNLTVHGSIWTDSEPNTSDINITVNHIDDVATSVTKLWDEKIAVVCSPDYTIRGHALREVSQLSDARLIHILARSVYWEKVAAQLDLGEIYMDNGFRTNASNIALEMAAKKLGCVALPKTLARPYLERNILIEPFEIDIPSPWTYFLEVQGKRITPWVASLKDCLLEKAAETEQQHTLLS